MTCERIGELLGSYIDGEVGADERNFIEAHLKSCSRCSLLLASLERVRLTLASFPEIEVRADLKSRLYAIPEKRKRSKLKLKLSLDFLLRPSLQPVFAAATVFMILISFYLFHPNRATIDRSIDRNLHLGYSQVEKFFARAGIWVDQLNAYKDNLLVSLKEWNILGGNEEKTSPTSFEEESPWKKRSS
ncbi:MAG: anti-sigma factor family protein [Candidatus Aminicenantales bacterium]